MKAFYALALAVLLVGCSTTETSPPDSETLVLSESAEPDMSSDTLFAPDEAPTSDSASLATPVEPSSDAEPLLSQPTPPAIEPLPPLPSVESPPSVAEEATAPAMPPVVQAPGATNPNRNIRQEFEEYKDQAKTRARAEDEYIDRSLFAHEDGAFQFGFDYAYRPFEDFDFNPGVGTKFAENQGGALAFNYFPLRSLSYGRLGVGAQAAAYWSKLTFIQGNGLPETTNRHTLDTIGGKLIYEFQYFLGQIVVPYAFYGYDMVRVKSVQLDGGINYPARRFNSQSYGAGAHLNLNRLEGRAASKALASSGIRKFYLSYTLLQRAESTGASHFLGLRFEY